MKTVIFSIAAILFTITIEAQVAVGKNSVSNPSTSLEFAGTENRGLVLPYIEDNSGISQDGTMIFDTTDNKVKYLKSGSWFDLSVDTTGNADLSVQTTKTEKTEAKVSIGTLTSTDGILVLEDSNKAMILPKVASPHLNIINPAAGMIVYDTTAHQLAVYNGSVWSFWKP
ncbi:hypothetical protein [Chryseobacterium viscerum]|uniref:Uncharacterized protein n=1 Tax=Chryseobacterium viscerum TaxID=1037377 RepID=A0A5N4BJL7_9FLAO|nr:hypothetical protein [Chryseobacterium viscerum]KAB1228618.1 hypothetical protein F8D52_22050 [Chryseobacterium viscerum]